jgi:hypothetical protein
MTTTRGGRGGEGGVVVEGNTYVEHYVLQALHNLYLSFLYM